MDDEHELARPLQRRRLTSHGVGEVHLQPKPVVPAIAQRPQRIVLAAGNRQDENSDDGPESSTSPGPSDSEDNTDSPDVSPSPGPSDSESDDNPDVSSSDEEQSSDGIVISSSSEDSVGNGDDDDDDNCYPSMSDAREAEIMRGAFGINLPRNSWSESDEEMDVYSEEEEEEEDSCCPSDSSYGSASSDEDIVRKNARCSTRVPVRKKIQRTRGLDDDDAIKVDLAAAFERVL